MNAHSRRRLGLRLGLLYSRNATALAGAERVSARRWEPGLIRPEARYRDRARLGLRLGKQGLPFRLVLKVRRVCYCIGSA